LEERGIAFYVNGAYGNSIKAFTEFPFQYSRPRLYQALTHHGLIDHKQATTLIKELNVINPEPMASKFMLSESSDFYRTQIQTML